MAELCQVLTPDCDTAAMLETYIKLCSDRVWAVRKACADVLPDLSKLASMELRVAQLVPVFDHFCEDVSHWVQIAALQQLGPFIATLEQDNVPESETSFSLQSCKCQLACYMLEDHRLSTSFLYWSLALWR